MNYKTLFFDYDGTIHDSIQIYFPAFLKAYDYLVNKGLQPQRQWTLEEVKKFLGQNPLEMWRSFEPKLPFEEIDTVIKLVGKEMTRAIANYEAVLYDGALETLQYLRDKGYTLVYLSNSKIYYMEYNREQFDLGRFFSEFVVSEHYDYIPKKDILRIISKSYEGPYLMIGDRIHDIESGIENNIDTVACVYGYGTKEELKHATFAIHDIRDLKELL